jgi:hypothetical protein
MTVKHVNPPWCIDPAAVLAGAGANLRFQLFGAIVVSTRRKMKLTHGFERRRSLAAYRPQGWSSRYKRNVIAPAHGKLEGP